MAQRFPLATSPFPRVELADADKRHFHVLATQQLAQALSEYEEHLLMQKRRVDSKRWKPVKAHDGLTIYRESRAYAVANGTALLESALVSEGGEESLSGGWSNSDPSSVDYEQPTYHQSEEELLSGWGPTASEVSERKKRAKKRSNSGFGRMLKPGDQLPTLLGVGCIAGSLDDVMYGVAAPDCASIFLKAAYTAENFLDGDVLCQIEGPSARSPFRFLGLKWHVKASSNPASRQPSWPRDVVYLEATGVVTRADSQRVGYQIIHSVPLSTCPGLQESHGLVRAHCESVHLFAALPNGSVDAFLKAKMTPNGKASEAAGVEGCADTLLAFVATVELARSKKLTWQLAHKARRPGDVMGVTAEVPKPKRCSSCSKSFGRFSRQPVVCKLCSAAMCSKCCITRELHQVAAEVRRRQSSKQVTSRTVLLCKSCVANVIQSSSLTVVQDEVASRRFGRVTRPTRSHSGNRHSGDDDTVPPSTSNSTVDDDGSVNIRCRPTPEEAPMSVRSHQQEIHPSAYQCPPPMEFPPGNHSTRHQDEVTSGRHRQQEEGSTQASPQDHLPQYRDPSLYEALLGIPRQEEERPNSRCHWQGEASSSRQRSPGEELPVPSYPPRYPGDDVPPPSYRPRYNSDGVPVSRSRPRYPSDENPSSRRQRFPSDKASKRGLGHHRSGSDSPSSTRQRHPAEGVPPPNTHRQQNEARPVHQPRYLPEDAIENPLRQLRLAPLTPRHQQTSMPRSRCPSTQPEVAPAPQPCGEEKAFSRRQPRQHQHQQSVAPEDNSEDDAPRQQRFHSHDPPVVLYEPEGVPSCSSRKDSAGKNMSSSSGSPEGVHLNALTLATVERLATTDQPELEVGGLDDWAEAQDASGNFDESAFSDDVDETLDTKDMQAVRRRSQSHRKLWDQIAELRDQAENVYQYTKTNAAAHAAGMNARGRG